jgi:hypothetical protein
MRNSTGAVTKNPKQVLDNPNGEGSISLVVSHKDVSDRTSPEDVRRFPGRE